MIWIWIVAAIVLSMICLKGRKISFENYIWLLLPVDMYGVNIGFTLKPYMIFSALLGLRMMKKYRGKMYIGSGMFAIWIILCPIAVLINIVNCGNQSSTMAALMFMVVFLCASIYISNVHGSLNQIPEVLVASSIGYGVVFILAYVIAYFGIPIKGAFTTSRELQGIIMQFNNMRDNQLVSVVRLRGFSIDPNTVIGLFIAPVAVDILVLFCEGGKSKRHLMSLLISLVCILMTNSRMAFLVTMIIVLVSAHYAFLNLAATNQRKNLISAICIIVLMLCALLINSTSSYIAEYLMGLLNRASLNDAHGRFTIWRESIQIWCKEGFFFGIGLGQMKQYTSLGLECHNTWLEWLCSSGIFVGGWIVAYYWTTIIKAIRKRITVYSTDMQTYHALMFGFIGVTLALLSVDNITNSYLCFFMFTLNKVQSELKRYETLSVNRND